MTTENPNLGNHSEGWAMPHRVNQFHYFRNGRSLCETQAAVGLVLHPDEVKLVCQPKDCATCFERRLQDAPPKPTGLITL